MEDRGEIKVGVLLQSLALIAMPQGRIVDRWSPLYPQLRACTHSLTLVLQAGLMR
jgi:hypothetical protein